MCAASVFRACRTRARCYDEGSEMCSGDKRDKRVISDRSHEIVSRNRENGWNRLRGNQRDSKRNSAEMIHDSGIPETESSRCLSVARKWIFPLPRAWGHIRRWQREDNAPYNCNSRSKNIWKLSLEFSNLFYSTAIFSRSVLRAGENDLRQTLN